MKHLVSYLIIFSLCLTLVPLNSSVVSHTTESVTMDFVGYGSTEVDPQTFVNGSTISVIYEVSSAFVQLSLEVNDLVRSQSLDITTYSIDSSQQPETFLATFEFVIKGIMEFNLRGQLDDGHSHTEVIESVNGMNGRHYVYSTTETYPEVASVYNATKVSDKTYIFHNPETSVNLRYKSESNRTIGYYAGFEDRYHHKIPEYSGSFNYNRTENGYIYVTATLSTPKIYQEENPSLVMPYYYVTFEDTTYGEAMVIPSEDDPDIPMSIKLSSGFTINQTLLGEFSTDSRTFTNQGRLQENQNRQAIAIQTLYPSTHIQAQVQSEQIYHPEGNLQNIASSVVPSTVSYEGGIPVQWFYVVFDQTMDTHTDVNVTVSFYFSLFEYDVSDVVLTPSYHSILTVDQYGPYLGFETTEIVTNQQVVEIPFYISTLSDNAIDTIWWTFKNQSPGVANTVPRTMRAFNVSLGDGGEQVTVVLYANNSQAEEVSRELQVTYDPVAPDIEGKDLSLKLVPSSLHSTGMAIEVRCVLQDHGNPPSGLDYVLFSVNNRTTITELEGDISTTITELFTARLGSNKVILEIYDLAGNSVTYTDTVTYTQSSQDRSQFPNFIFIIIAVPLMRRMVRRSP